jgi:hypothetical protein
MGDAKRALELFIRGTTFFALLTLSVTAMLWYKPVEKNSSTRAHYPL